MVKRRSHSVNGVRDQVGTLAQTIIEQAAQRAVFGAERAKETAHSAKDKMPGGGRSSDEIAPAIRDIALQAASAAIDLWQATRERAEGVVANAEHAIGDSGNPSRYSLFSSGTRIPLCDQSTLPRFNARCPLGHLTQ